MTDLPGQNPGRRTYKRYVAQVWEQHKEIIRELFLEQDKTHDELAAILADRHGLDVGARQLKRKTNEWGFVKKIPAKEMGKMVRARQRRQEQLGRPTKFLRNPGSGGFQVVPAAKLDAYQKRFGVPGDSAMSPSSGLPSNIMCQTPSSHAAPALRVGSRGVGSAIPAARSRDEMALEFNNSIERVFGDIRNDDDDDNVTSRSSLQQSSRDGPIRQLTIPAKSLYLLARDYAFDGHYQSAAQNFKLLTQIYHNSWPRVIYQFRAEVMDAACYSGCPQSLAARVADILSRSLVREREKYGSSNSEIGDEVELRKVLYVLRATATYWGSVIVQQRAVQIWEPILGPNHPKVTLLRDNLASMRSSSLGSCDFFERYVQGVETSDLSAPLAIDQLPSLKRVGDLLLLGDAPGNQLLEKLHAIESSSASGQQFRLEVARLRFGRSRALLGLYYSFICRFWDAQKAFEDSERLMEHETCVEIKLHRMLWYAEHKTRVQDWNSVSRLISRAHAVFMANDTASAFIIDHFPDLFKSLCSAVSMRIPIDKITNDAAVDASSPDYLQPTSGYPPSPIPGTPAIAHSSPAVANSVLSPQRLFPPTPRGANAKINIDAWRQFVHFTPAGGTPPGAGIN
ncbi:hypothetical protein VTI74DRAFT_6380 [Chaetomium olivicolor]